MPAVILARLLVIEARRGGLAWLAAASIVIGAGLAAFLSQIALTESAALQAAIVGAVLRGCAVFLVAAHVASSTLREINDKGLEVMLALPVSRTAHYVGRAAGYAIPANVLAVAFSLPLLAWAPAGAVALWGVSLACEAALVAAVALFFSMTLAQLVPAIAATLALYVLARVMPAIQLIANGPLAEASPAHELARWSVEAVAVLLPRLDAVTRTEWLLYGAPALQEYLWALAALGVYAAVVISAGLVDFYRRSL